MKVAVCLSGFPRLLDYTFPYFKKYILDPLKADIFYYGYSDIENNISKEKIIELYKPKKYFIREFNSEVEEEIWHKYGTREILNNRLSVQPPMRILSQFFNLYGSNQLKKQYELENNFEYNIVIRARTDYFFYRAIDENELKIEKGHISIPDVWDFGGVSDGFAFGNSKDMDIYSNIFYKIKNYNLNGECIFHPETMQAYHIFKSGLTRKIVKNHYWWELIDFEYQNCQSSYIDELKNNPSRRNFK